MRRTCGLGRSRPLASRNLVPYIQVVKAVLTSKGQITIPVRIRTRLGLKAGDELEFDEEAPYLKATRPIPRGAWDQIGRAWKDPDPALRADEMLEGLRGPVAMPPSPEPGARGRANRR